MQLFPLALVRSSINHRLSVRSMQLNTFFVPHVTGPWEGLKLGESSTAVGIISPPVFYQILHRHFLQSRCSSEILVVFEVPS